MTVAVQTNRVSYTGNGITDEFTVPFKFLDNGDLIVSIDGVNQTLDVDYTVSGAGNPNGGTITFTAPPDDQTTVFIANDPPLNQLVEFVNNVTFLEGVLNNALDKLTIISQITKELIGDTLRHDPAISPSFWDGENRELRNLIDGTLPSSAATVAQLQALQIAEGNVPYPASGEIGKFLEATGVGTFGWTTVDLTVFALLAGSNTISADNIYTGNNTFQVPPIARRTETDQVRTFLRLIGGDGSGTEASLRALCNATGVDDMRAYLGNNEYFRLNGNGTRFARQAYMPFVQLTDAATINWDLSVAPYAFVTLAGNRTLAAPTNFVDGGVYTLFVQQDGTGGRTLNTSNAIFRFPGGINPVIAAGANAITIITFICRDDKLYGVTSFNFL